MTTVASFSTFISSLANEEVPGVDCIRAVVEDDGGSSDWAEVAKTSSHFLECFVQLLEPGDETLPFGDEHVRIDMVCCASKFYEAAFLLTAVKKLAVSDMSAAKCCVKLSDFFSSFIKVYAGATRIVAQLPTKDTTHARLQARGPKSASSVSTPPTHP